MLLPPPQELVGGDGPIVGASDAMGLFVCEFSLVDFVFNPLFWFLDGVAKYEVKGFGKDKLMRGLERR